MKTVCLEAPFNKEDFKDLNAGDMVIINGNIYTARDAAHKRISDMLADDIEPPVDLKDQAVYYAGPCPAGPGKVIGPVGPTTSGRMDAYTQDMIEKCGVSVIIGKGERADFVRKNIVDNSCLYLVAIGGCGALISHSVVESEVVAFDDLGTEAIRRLKVKDFKCYVGIDLNNNCIYDR